MVKIFSILTLLVSLAAAYLGFESKNLVEAFKIRADKEHTNLLEKTAKLKKTEDTLAATEADLKMTKEDLEKTKETLRTKETELDKTKTELAATMTMLAEKDKELVDLKDKFAKLNPVPGPPGEDIAKKLDDLVKAKADLETKAQTLEKEKAELTTTVETLTANKKELEGRIEPMKAEIKKYKEGIIQEGLTGRVLAVNSGWGFCVLSIGDSKGAAANRVLIVRRGGEAIGRVKITAVESSQSVADIITSSFAKGTYIQPGDEVIYKKGSEGLKTEGDGAAGGGSPQPPQLPLPNR